MCSAGGLRARALAATLYRRVMAGNVGPASTVGTAGAGAAVTPKYHHAIFVGGARGQHCMGVRRHVLVAEEAVADDDDGVDVADVNPSDFGLQPRRDSIHSNEQSTAPADDPRQRFTETAHRLRAEIPRLLEPAMLSADLLERDIELRDNTINVSFRGRTTHDLVLGAAAAGTRLALVDAEIRVLSYSWCVETRRITCRWQIVGTPRVPLTRVYHDRVSFFDVNDRGRIWRHTIDRITPSASQRRAPSLRDLLFPWQVADCRASVAAVAAHI